MKHKKALNKLIRMILDLRSYKIGKDHYVKTGDIYSMMEEFFGNHY